MKLQTQIQNFWLGCFLGKKYNRNKGRKYGGGGAAVFLQFDPGDTLQYNWIFTTKIEK